jgi:hypothetical protein
MSLLSDDNIRTYYMSRRLDLPPLVAQAAYDAHFGSAERPGGAGWRPLRRLPGVLVAARRRWPMELELLPWSEERTELGLRPRSRFPRVFPPEQVTLAGHELLDELAASMVEWAERPLSEWASESTARNLTGYAAR